MFKTEASRTPTGNWQRESSCQKGHRVFTDQMHPNSLYKCPYCGSDVY